MSTSEIHGTSESDTKQYLHIEGHPCQSEQIPVRNTGNLRAYEPYYAQGDCLHVDTDFWLNDIIQSVTTKVLWPKLVLDTQINVPHPVTATKTLEERTLYNAYADMFDAHLWAPKLGEKELGAYMLVNIPPHIKALILACNLSGRKPHESVVEWIHTTFTTLPHPECFIRLSGCSGKHDGGVPLPVTSWQDIMSYLCDGNYSLIKREFAYADKDTYIFLRRWETLLCAKFEFRIFVHHGQLVAASQQHPFKVFEYTDTERRRIVAALNAFAFSECFRKVPYRSWVGDVWYNSTTERLQFIEANPYGAHSGSGSALFEWEADHALLTGKHVDKGVIFRYLV